MAYASVYSIARQFSKNSIITHCVDMSSQSQRIKQKWGYQHHVDTQLLWGCCLPVDQKCAGLSNSRTFLKLKNADKGSNTSCLGQPIWKNTLEYWGWGVNTLEIRTWIWKLSFCASASWFAFYNFIQQTAALQVLYGEFWASSISVSYKG